RLHQLPPQFLRGDLRHRAAGASRLLRLRGLRPGTLDLRFRDPLGQRPGSVAAVMILVTGANGYVGGKLLGENVIAWVRAGSETEARARLPGHSGEVAFGELGRDDAFAGVDPDRITAIVHTAAVTRFNVDADTATEVNR